MNFIWCLNSTKFNWKDEWVSYGFFSTVWDIFTFSSSRHLSFSFSPVKKDIVSFVSREFSWFLGCRLLPRTERLMFHLKLSRIKDGTVCSSSKKQTYLIFSWQVLSLNIILDYRGFMRSAKIVWGGLLTCKSMCNCILQSIFYISLYPSE